MAPGGGQPGEGFPPVADLLDHLAPPARAWPVILMTAPAVLASDAVHEAVRNRREARS